MAPLAPVRYALPLLVLCALAPGARGQSALYTFYGDGAEAWFGISVAGAGDVDGDGIDDLIVGAYGDDANGKDSGLARVLSGADGRTLFTFHGDAPNHRFGLSVDGAGDVDGDGHADLIVGAPYGDGGNGPNSGLARVFSGRDGSVLAEFGGLTIFDHLGSVAGAGDVNRDGFADWIAGAEGEDAKGPNSGSARVFSGRDGSILYAFFGSSDYELLGISVGGAGDVNADGFDDVIVGAPYALPEDAGRVRVHSGADGSVLHTFKGKTPEERLGLDLDGAGDVNADGFADVIVSAATGTVRVFSGADGSLLHELHGESSRYYGPAVGGAGDVDGDGFADVVVGSPSLEDGGPGSATVFSGRDGSALYTLVGDADGDRFGASVSGAGDVDGDGFADLIVGAYGDDDHHGGSGSARVFSGCSRAGRSYCGPAVPNSAGGPAEIRAGGSVAVADGYLVLRAASLPPERFGAFLVGERPGLAQPGGSQGQLCLGGRLGRFGKQVASSGPEGQLTIRVDLANLPTMPPRAVQPGETWFFQAWYRDANPAPTSNFTDAVGVTFR